MKSAVFALIFFLSLLSHESFAAVDKGAPRKPVFEVFNVSAFSRLEINNEPGGQDFLPRPVLSYFNLNKWADQWQFSLITAGIFNRIEVVRSLNRQWAWTAAASGLFLVHGDRPKIDGEDFSDIYDFRGHTWSAQSGLAYRLRLFRKSYQARLEGLYRGHFFYEDPRTPLYTIPSNFSEVGPIFKFEPLRRSMNELKDFGFYPSFMVGGLWRLNSEAWGLSGGILDPSFSSVFELGLDFAASLRSFVALDLNSNFVFMTDADRINAASNGSFGPDFSSMFLGNVKTDRSFKLETGPRFYLEAQRKIALRPFYFNAFYRELLLNGNRNRQAFGGGLRLMGEAFKGKLTYSLAYGAVEGVVRDKVMHQFNSLFSYRFL